MIMITTSNASVPITDKTSHNAALSMVASTSVFGSVHHEAGLEAAPLFLFLEGQRLHFIDPIRGRVTAQYKVYLEDDIGLTA